MYKHFIFRSTVAGMDSDAGSVFMLATTPASPYFLDSALPSDSDLNYDHHSSEEELEVINSTPHHTQDVLRSRSASTLPEKRKWSQVKMISEYILGSLLRVICIICIIRPHWIRGYIVLSALSDVLRLLCALTATSLMGRGDMLYIVQISVSARSF